MNSRSIQDGAYHPRRGDLVRQPARYEARPSARIDCEQIWLSSGSLGLSPFSEPSRSSSSFTGEQRQIVELGSGVWRVQTAPRRLPKIALEVGCVAAAQVHSLARPRLASAAMKSAVAPTTNSPRSRAPFITNGADQPCELSRTQFRRSAALTLPAISPVARQAYRVRALEYCWFKGTMAPLGSTVTTRLQGGRSGT